MPPKLATPALLRTLTELPELVPVERMDRIWVFPPRVVGDVESGLLVLSLTPEVGGDGEARREVVTVQYELRSGKGAQPLAREVAGRGWAPPERVPQLIAGVVRRLGSEEEEPVSESIEGDAERFGHFLAQLTGSAVDQPNGE